LPQRNGIRLTILLASLAVASALAPGVAAAETFKVTTTIDGDDKECELDCTLREAVARAGPSDQVDVPAGTYLLTLGELFLTSDTIVGAGARSTVIDGDDTSRVLWVTDGMTSVTGVTIRRGNGEGGSPSGVGGGIYIQGGASLTLIQSTVTQNVASAGGGIFAAGNLSLIASTVSANRVVALRGASGGGIGSAQGAFLGIGNSTISNNAAEGAASVGGGVHSTGSLATINATFSGNRAATGGALYVLAPDGGSASVDNTVLATGTGGACGGPGLAAVAGDFNVVGDDSCLFKGQDNQHGVDPRLAGLDDYGGPTNTHALLPASPAIDAGSGCGETDQRGVLRPQPRGGLCDPGAFEYRAPTLTVITQVTNNNRGTLTPDQASVHVLLGNDDVKGSPSPGSPGGRRYTLDAFRTYTVAAAVPGYSVTISGHCAPNGNIGLWEGQNMTCTVTADDQPATLRVITEVVNDDGGTRSADQFFVRLSGDAVAESGGPGNEEGAVFGGLDAGGYRVSADSVNGYTFTFAGDCAPDGEIALDVGESRSCTVIANDDPPPVTVSPSVQQQSQPAPPPQADEQQPPPPLPPPEPGETVNAEPRSGTVKVKVPGSKRFVALADGEQLPVGTVVDARKGHVTLVAAADKNGATATAEFWAGIFKIAQTRGKKPITTLALTEKLSCPKRGKASTAAKRKKKRRLWGNGTGRFRTKGSYSSATVRGTKWLTQDTCTSTLTRVVQGTVSVRDLVKKKIVVVKAGKRYVAKRKR
jgi:CSLREA domain-containing protein